MLNILRSLTAHIYDIFISFFFTLAAHLLLIDHMHLSGGNFLDVGCGTGKPLHAIIRRLKQIHQKIVGVDMHPAYTEKAIKLFEGDKQVEIYNMDFYKIADYLQLKFRTVFFSFSFMLMPDQLKALEVAKNILEKSPESRICFTLTVNKSKNSLLSKIKPLIKRITTVDFGNVVYEESFLSVLDSADLEVLKFVRLKSTFNLFLWLAPVYYVECRLKQNIN
jgi:ubiquinone/menaquinone biosynthesis C-methylase UbiE